MNYTVGNIAQARLELSNYVLRTAPRHHTAADAPNTWQALLDWHRATCNDTMRSLPVYDGASERTVYVTPAANHAFRAWHDATHIRLNADFTYAGEKLTAERQTSEAKEHGISELAQLMLWYDTYGQVELFQQRGGFAANQLAFVSDCIRQGLAFAIKHATVE